MTSTRVMLSLMMFLQFFIWGAWFPLVFDYLPGLGFQPLQIGLILATFNVAALVGLFFSNQFADRNFSAEKFLAFSQFVGGLAMLGLFWVKAPATTKDDSTLAQLTDPSFLAFFSLLLVHSLFYVPTISITNAIAFANLRDPQNEFGPVRLWGTIGWIAASWPFVFILIDWTQVATKYAALPADEQGVVAWLGVALGTPLQGGAMLTGRSYTFVVAGAASLLLAVFSFALPHTPPRPAGAGGERLAWLEAVRLLRYPFVLVLFVATFIDAAVHQYFFFFTPTFLEKGPPDIPGNWIMPVMSIGQIAEILTMAVLGYVLKTLGWRTTMILGILGHVARFAVFAYMPTRELAILVNVLHGICYAFFFATVYIFVDEFFPKDARSSAQGLFNVLILGVGPLTTNLVAPYLADFFKTEAGAPNYRLIFSLPMIAALAAAMLMLLFFHPPRPAEDKAKEFARGH